MSDSDRVTEGLPAEAEAPSAARRRFLLSAGATVAGAGFLAHALGGARVARAAESRATAQLAQADATPIGSPWWPSKWGADDQMGASNHMTPAKTLEAASLIKTGKVYPIGHVYEPEMPLFGKRVWALRIPGAPTGGAFADNKVIWNDEFLATEIGQVGTQFDGLGHIGVEIDGPGNQAEKRFYNGHALSEIASPYGLTKLGVEHVKPFFTRGILVDVKGLKGGTLAAGEEITVADIEAALKKQGLSAEEIRPGDAVFLRTGWTDHWIADNETYNGGEPGIGRPAAEWLAGKDVSLVGADTWGVDAVPNPEGLAFPAHQILLVRNGIYIHENLQFEALAADGISLFAYIYAPLPLKGATGSPGAPIAVV
jgi:kynurenine formamidase